MTRSSSRHDCTVYTSISQSINQSINQSISQSVSQSVYTSISQSINQSINQYKLNATLSIAHGYNKFLKTSAKYTNTV